MNDIEIRVPKVEKRVDWVVTPMYNLWLSLWLNFPFGELVQDFCMRLMITSIQINPNTLKILLTMNQMNVRFSSLDLFLLELVFTYSTQMVYGDQSCIQFHLNSGEVKSFLHTTKRDNNSGDQFLFVRGNWRRSKDTNILSF